jgi:hypothetical protein
MDEIIRPVCEGPKGRGRKLKEMENISWCLLDREEKW